MSRNLFILLGIFLFLAIFISSAGASSVSRTFKDVVAPNEQFTVFLTVDITNNEQYYLIDEMYPIGFKIISSDTGSIVQDGHVRWGIISGARSTTLTYKLQAPSAKGDYNFIGGQYIFEGDKDASDIVGQRTIKVDPSASDTKCLDKCENDIIYQKGIFDPKIGCIYQTETLCKYGCDYAAKSIIPPCKLVPDIAPVPNSTDYSDTIWNMVKSLWDKQNSPSSQKGTMVMFGTEYKINDRAKVWLQLINSTGHTIEDGMCLLDIYSPDNTIFIENAQMHYFGEEGIYYYDFLAPERSGTYPMIADCSYSSVSQIETADNATIWTGANNANDYTDTYTKNGIFWRIYEALTLSTYRIDYIFNFTNVTIPPLMSSVTLDWWGKWNGQVEDDLSFYIWNYSSSKWYELPNAVENTGASNTEVTNSIPTNNVTASGLISGGQMRVRITDTNTTDIVKSEAQNDYIALELNYLSNPAWQEVKGSSEMHVSSGNGNDFLTVHTLCSMANMQHPQLDETSDCSYFTNDNEFNQIEGEIEDNISIYSLTNEANVETIWEYESPFSVDCTAFYWLKSWNGNAWIDISDNVSFSSDISKENCIVRVPIMLNPNGVQQSQYLYRIKFDNYMKWEALYTKDVINVINDTIYPFCIGYGKQYNYTYNVPITDTTNMNIPNQVLYCERVLDDVYWWNLYYDNSLGITTSGAYASYLIEARTYRDFLQKHLALGNFFATYGNTLSLLHLSGESDYMGLMINSSYLKARPSIGIHGTEYNTGDPATIFLQLVDIQGNFVNNGSCHIDMYYPNQPNVTHGTFIQDAPMIYLNGSDGLYFYDLTAPNITGVYMESGTCSYGYQTNWLYEPNDFRNSVISIIQGTYTGNTTALNSYQDGIYMRCSSASPVPQSCIASYDFNSSGINNITSIEIYYAGENTETTARLQMSIWNWTSGSWIGLPNILGFNGRATVSNPIGLNDFLTNTASVNNTINGSGIIRIRLLTNASASFTLWDNWLSLRILTSEGQVVETKGSGEMHIGSWLFNITANMNQSQLNSILIAIASVNQTLNSTILNYLVTINGTTFNINGTEYNSLLSAINSVNITATANQNFLVGINSSLANLTASELSHYNSLIAFLASINTTLNTTLEYKLDLINGTVMQINQTTFNTLQQIVAMNNSFTQYLVVINGTAQQINSSQFLYYTNLLAAINSVNQTLNTTVLNYLIGINGTVYNTNQQIPLILQYLNDINMTTNTTIPASLISINNTQNQHFVEIMNFLASINYTANTTLELKLDQINSTIIQINKTVNQINATTSNITIDIQPILNAIASVNTTLNTTIFNLLTQINTTTMQNQNYLLVINGTVFQINDSILGIINQINSVNNTQNQNYLSLYNLLIQINQTGNTTLEFVASINQSLLGDYISLYNILLSVNGSIQDLNASEYQHFQELFVILTDINYTTNTTLENKLDLINYTTWQTWIMLQNLTIGNVTVTASVNWSEGIPYIWNVTSPYVINNKLISLSDQGIQLVTETLTCLSNSTLQHFINATSCLQGICSDSTKTITEICNWGCRNNQCLPAPQFQYFYAFGFILLLASAVYVAWRANK